MKIEKNTVVKLEFIVTDEKNQVLNVDSKQEIEVLIGHNMLVKGFEESILGHEAGDKVNAIVEPKDGYGEYNPNLVQEIQKDLFEGMSLGVGDTFMADTDMGQMPITVKEIQEDKVIVDGNHPYAGKLLKYLIEIKDVREATETEIEHGHVHGEHGCCHGHDHDEEHECCHGHHHHDHDEHECCGKHKHHDHDAHDDEEHHCCGKHHHDDEHEHHHHEH